MSTCGYVCPACSGSGFDEHGNNCHWCSFAHESVIKNPISDEDWIKNVHEGPCCSDIGSAPEDDTTK